MGSHGENGDQLAFDIEEMIRQARIDSAPPWVGAPLSFTTDYYASADLDAAFSHWQLLHGSHSANRVSHMWHRSVAAPEGTELGRHRLDVFAADLRYEPWNHPGPRGRCDCVGDLMSLAICEPCRWHTISSGENPVVEAWHDHALSGWRDLPVVPAAAKHRDQREFDEKTKAWIARQYPPTMQIQGAPIITERSTDGTRHVPGRSPFGGYDLSHTALTGPTRRRTPSIDIAPAPPAARATGFGIGD